MLVSPQFLFRIERDPKPARPSHHRPRARLAPQLLSSGARCPTTNCCASAKPASCIDPPVLDAQVKRMIADPKSAAFADNFVGQWLRNPQPRRREARREEVPRMECRAQRSDAHRDQHVLRGGAARGPPDRRLPRRQIHLPERIAREALRHRRCHRPRVPPCRSDDRPAQRRPHPGQRPDRLRAIPPALRWCCAASTCSKTSSARRPRLRRPTSRARRRAVGVAKSLRQQMEQHRSDAVCASCHSKMDVLGFGTRKLRRHRPVAHQDGKFPVDASGAFPNGKSFTTPDGNEGAAPRQHAGVHPLPRRENADLRARPGRRILRPPHRSQTSSTRPQPAITNSRR